MHRRDNELLTLQCSTFERRLAEPQIQRVSLLRRVATWEISALCDRNAVLVSSFETDEQDACGFVRRENFQYATMLVT